MSAVRRAHSQAEGEAESSRFCLQCGDRRDYRPHAHVNRGHGTWPIHQRVETGVQNTSVLASCTIGRASAAVVNSARKCHRPGCLVCTRTR